MLSCFPFLAPTSKIINFHIQYIGDIRLLSYKPNIIFELGSKLSFLEYDQSVQEVIISLENRGHSELINNHYFDLVSKVSLNYRQLKKELVLFNKDVKTIIKDRFDSTKLQILEKRKLLSELGVPVRLSPKGMDTFLIPDPLLRKKIIIAPSIPVNGYTPEPTITDEIYFEILKRINDSGKNFERMPSIYTDRGEEDLRDHILFNLDPQFQMGSAGGETFNKIGKTDISIRYDSSVVFVAECKFWRGQKSLVDTLDQLLGYLTWRDSKTSMIIFVDKKSITDVISQVSETILKHRCFIKQEINTSDGWFNYIFSLPGDANREIKMAAQFYHIPRIEKKN